MRIIYLLFAFFPLLVCAQNEPGNNLGKSVYELRQKFPDLVRWGGYESEPNYKSPKANTLFTFKNNHVAIEYTLIEGGDDYLQDLFFALVDRFQQGARRVLWSNNRRVISLFYSNFYVYLSYTPYSDVSIKYQLYSY